MAPSVAEGRALLQAAHARGLKHGAVEDKLYLPGLQKLSRLAASDFFGRVTGFRFDFGWWVFDGTEVPCQRPSWNYRRSGGGGLILDMYPHWRYVIEDMLGPIAPRRRRDADRDPRAHRRARRSATRSTSTTPSSTLVELESGAIGTILCSWATRVRRDDLLTFQIDGTGGSAIAGLHRCWTRAQRAHAAHRRFNPDTDIGVDYRAHWTEVADAAAYTNPYRVGWENFLRHVVAGAPLLCDFAAGIRDVQFAEACYRSVAQRTWVSIDDIAG